MSLPVGVAYCFSGGLSSVRPVRLWLRPMWWLRRLRILQSRLKAEEALGPDSDGGRGLIPDRGHRHRGQIGRNSPGAGDLMLERPRFKPHLRVEVVPGEGAFVLAGGSQTLLKGKPV